jgi:hypothetical protein
MKAKLLTYEQVTTELDLIGKEQLRLEIELDACRDKRDAVIGNGFKVGVTAAKMVEALGIDHRTGKPIIGPARVFQIRDEM